MTSIVYAKWPKGTVGFNKDITEARCITQEEVDITVDILQEEGYDGEGEVFPKKVWVEEINVSTQVLH